MYDLSGNEYNAKLAEALKKIKDFEMPEWAYFVKTGVIKERVPEDKDFWFKRAASILRQIYIRKVVGVSRLKTRYGGRMKRGCKPEEFRKGGGKIIRTILHQAEKAELVEKVTGKKPGRKLTKKGTELLDSIK
ncbi:30S ribosomal protein S19e [Candidatus Woesearchaeota archaeon CG10_big_fil_rev_8_21_14_0_10_34_12]|nr:MAG: 30S ribosomal protein S19e [Candidatus Woesearchaeota archaeon CG10_big_fil_rev_8_21_14_0_10_34_12]